MRTRLNQTSFDQSTKTVLGWSFSSFAMCRDTTAESDDFKFAPKNLLHELKLAEDTRTPILVHMNDGHWAAGSFPNATGSYDDDTLIEWLARKYPEVTMYNPDGTSQYSLISGENWFSLSRLNEIYLKYKERNVLESAKVVARWAKKNPELFVGVSLESEPRMNNLQSDYNPYVIKEWKQWLAHTGIYGPGGKYFGQGRLPRFKQIEDFNRALGTSFSSWDDLSPPETPSAGDALWEEWHRWRITQIDHTNADNTLLMIKGGIDRKLVYGHLTPQVNFYAFADDINIATASLGAGGLTFYGWDPVNYGGVIPPLRARGSNLWGNFELNPLSKNVTLGYENMEALRKHGMKVVCPNAWEDYAHIRDMYALYGSVEFGDAWGEALSQWIADRETQPRFTQPVPWNPGQKIADLYDDFEDATESSGPDNHIEPNASCGGFVRKSLYSHVGGRMSWSINLPEINNPDTRRLNLWTSLGIMDGAPDTGGDATFQITINDEPLLGHDGWTLNKSFWLWKRWSPVMFDITEWAGQTVTVTLTTTGNNAGGWTIWGAAQVYDSGGSAQNLARGKSVTVSSTGGSRKDWTAAFLVDGRVDAGANGAIGWSSQSHSTDEAEEWAMVDLGAEKAVSKVVLFSRSDLSEANGSGFPVDFKIQGSSKSGDGGEWADLVSEVNFPGTHGGDGEIFLFESAKIKLIRVRASKLSGVAGEKGFALQLGEMEVYE